MSGNAKLPANLHEYIGILTLSVTHAQRANTDLSIWFPTFVVRFRRFVEADVAEKQQYSCCVTFMKPDRNLLR
ncbi:hypothetical protein EB810_07875 [Altererythrobacter sp. FM1]|nr:hypothetical protein EB810_07875 [Altererythrobacter sp. FM1]